MLYVFTIATLLITVGELADKSQLLALALATRYRVWQVLLGIFVATFAVNSFAVLVGQTIGAVIPAGVMPWVSGVMFVGFGVWTLRGDRVEEAGIDRERGRFGPVAATAIAFFFAELGDKTQIMTLTIAAHPGSALLLYLKGAGATVGGWLDASGITVSATSATQRFWAVTLGSTVGMVLADAVAIGAGRLMGRSLPERGLRIGSGLVFMLFGVATIIAPLVAG